MNEVKTENGVRFIKNNDRITWPEDQEYDKGEPCCMCGKPTSFKTTYAVCISGGADTIVHNDDTLQAEKVDSGFMGFYAIGPDCRKKLPKDFTVKYSKKFPNG